MDIKDQKEHDAITKATQDQWGFTPSLMDPNSFAFSSFASQPPAYYAATPTANVLQSTTNHAGDLHTPNMALNLLTPLAIPHSASTDPTMPHSAIDLGGFHAPFLSHQAPGVDPFANAHGFAPSTFLRRDPDLVALSRSIEEPPLGTLSLNNPSLGLVPGRIGDPMDGYPGHNEKYVPLKFSSCCEGHVAKYW